MLLLLSNCTHHIWARTMGGRPDCIKKPLAWFPLIIPWGVGPTDWNCCWWRALSSGRMVQGSPAPPAAIIFKPVPNHPQLLLCFFLNLTTLSSKRDPETCYFIWGCSLREIFLYFLHKLFSKWLVRCWPHCTNVGQAVVSCFSLCPLEEEFLCKRERFDCGPPSIALLPNYCNHRGLHTHIAPACGIMAFAFTALSCITKQGRRVSWRKA